MEEIKVGEYVRIRGELLKIELITNITDKDCYIKFDEYASGNTFTISEIKNWKHSSNIIDLIEEGDYVNGKLIHKVDVRENSTYIYYGNGKTFCDYQIKNVVTKEQFEQMKYIIGDESNE